MDFRALYRLEEGNFLWQLEKQFSKFLSKYKDAPSLFPKLFALSGAIMMFDLALLGKLRHLADLSNMTWMTVLFSNSAIWRLVYQIKFGALLMTHFSCSNFDCKSFWCVLFRLTCFLTLLDQTSPIRSLVFILWKVFWRWLGKNVHHMALY